jgi:hypothetical protein
MTPTNKPTARLTCLIIFLSAALHVWSAQVFAYDNLIAGVDPSSAERGTSGLIVTFTLDSGDPPPPPAGKNPDSAAIGTISGSSLTHDSQYVVTAAFDIPIDALTGTRDCEIVFTTPDGSLSYGLAGGFTITAPDAPPTISGQPQSQVKSLDEPVTFAVDASGTEPLTYQWQQDGADLAGETAASMTIEAVAGSDAGAYLCRVDNAYGTDTSDEATLIVDISVQTVTAPYPVVDSMQDSCFDANVAIACPAAGESFAGQDAQHQGYQSSYTVSADGLTVLDNLTGMTWVRSPDTDGDGDIDANDKLTQSEAAARTATLNAAGFGGYDDWRLPSIKELYSLFDSRGEDPSGVTGDDTSGLTPYIDTDAFEFAYGDTSAGERIIDSQWATTSLYVGTSDFGQLMFGVNFADGRIKGYPADNKTYYTIWVRGSSAYGVNDPVDNGDGTVSDLATGLMWQQNDSGSAMTWQEALALAETRNAEAYLGYSDWRLPNLKELQSIVDYTRSPEATGSAAIAPVFDATAITAEPCSTDYPWYWTSTTHANSEGNGGGAAYVTFGRAWGYFNGAWSDVHGAGCQRADPKDNDMSQYTFSDCGYYTTAPQGDATRSAHHVRLVRGGDGRLGGDFGWNLEEPTDQDTITFSASGFGGTSPYVFSWDLDGEPASGATVQAELGGGSHTVVLTITDAVGLESTVTREVTVSGDGIFSDSFESGEASAWSSTVS